MIVVVGTFRLPAHAIEKAKTAMARVIAASRTELGCLDYSYAFDVMDDGLVRVSEHWVDRPALLRHFESAHMLVWRDERVTLGLTERFVRAFEVGDGEAL